MAQRLVTSRQNLVITVGTVSGLLEPTAAWKSAGGSLSERSSTWCSSWCALSAVLTTSHHRRHRPHWTTLVVGSIVPPVLLGGLLVVVPAMV